MKVSEWVQVLAPYKIMMARKAASPTHRVMELAANGVRACSQGMSMATFLTASDGVDTAEPYPGLRAFVDAASFIAVVESLPGDAEMALGASEGVLSWRAGDAKGRLALSTVTGLPSFEPAAAALAPIPENLRQTLELGGLSCANAALQAVGMYGVVLTGGWHCACSSDDATISVFGSSDGGETRTLAPEGVELLAAIADPKAGRIGFSDDVVIYNDPRRNLFMRQVPPLKHDFLSLLGNYVTTEAEVVARMPAERVQAFIKRVGAIAEQKNNAYVDMGASEGHLTVSFSEGMASSDESYLLDDARLPDIAPIRLNAKKLARVLSEADDVVFDNADRNVLLFRGHGGKFLYLVSGRAA